MEGRGGGNDERQGLVAIDTGQHVVGVGHRGDHTPGRHAGEGAGGVVHHALEPEAIAVDVGVVVQTRQGGGPIHGAGAVVTAAIVLRHGRVVVAGRGIRASAEFILVADPVAIGVVEADTVTIDVGGRRVGTGAVLEVGVGVVVAGRRIETASIETGAVVHRGEDLEVEGRRVRAAGVNAGTVLVVGAGIEVVRRAVGATGVQAGPVVHVCRLIIVGRAGIDAPPVLAGGVVDVGTGVVVHGVRIQAAREEARAVVVVGTGIEVGCRRVGTTGVQARAVVLVGVRIEVGGGSVRAAFEDAGTVVVIGRRIVVDRIGVRAAGEQAGAVIHVGIGIEVGGDRNRAPEVLTGAVVLVGLGVVVVRLRVRAAEVHAAPVVGVGRGVEVVRDRVRAAVVDAGAVVVVGGRVVVRSVRIRAAAEDARAVALVGVRVVVVGRRVGATRNDAGAVVDVGLGVVVQGVRIGAPAEFTGAVVVVGISVEVVGGGVRAPAGVVAARAHDLGELGLAESLRSEGEGRTLLIAPIAEREDLHRQGAADHAVRGKLGHQHTEVCIRHTVEVGGRHKPGSAHRVVHADFTASVEAGDPVLVRALGALDGAVAGRRRAVQTDGHPAVVGDLREDAEKQGVDARAKGSAQGVLVEGRAGADDHRIGLVAIAAAEQVGRVVEDRVQAVGRQAGEGAGGVGRDPLHIEGIAHGVVGEGHLRQRVAEDGDGIPASCARAVFTAAVLFGGVRVVIAGRQIRASGSFELVAHPVAIGVVEAASVAIEVIHAPRAEGIEAGPVVGVGRGVIVAGRGICAAAEGAAAVIRVGAGIEVVRGRIRASREEAGAVVVVGPGIVVGGTGIRASWVQAGAVVDGRERVVVAGEGVEASGIQAGAVVEFGGGVEVRGRVIGAAPVADDDGADHPKRGLVGHGAVVVVHPRHREGEGAQTGALGRTEDGRDVERLRVVEGQARQLVRGGIDVVQTAHVDPDHGGPHIEGQQGRIEVEAARLDHRVRFDATGIEKDAAAILIGGGGIVVPGRLVRTTGDFFFVAGAVAVGVRQAVAVAIAEGRRVGAASVVVVGRGIKVAGRIVDAAAVEAGAIVNRGGVVVVVGLGVDATSGARAIGSVETEVEAQVAFAHAMLEDLNEKRARDLAVRRQLCQEHLVVIARDAIAVVLRHEPCPARGIVDDNVASRLEGEQPRLRGALDDTDLALIGRAVRLLTDADRHPGVVLQIREEPEQQGVDGIGSGRTQRVLEEGRCGVQVQREDGITTHGRHDVVGVHTLHVEVVGGHAGQNTGIVFGNDFHGQAVGGDLGMAYSQCRQAKKEGSQTVHVSTIWVGQS